MTTTAHEDQFTAEPEHVTHRPYDTGSILRRNVADLELALKQQAERAEAAEAELLAVREDNHSMMMEIDGLRKELAKLAKQKPVRWHVRGNYFHDGDAAILFASRNSMCGAKVDQLYAAPVPAPAVSDADSVARFEAWVLAQADAQPHWRIGRGTLCNKYPNGSYHTLWVDTAWEGWKACAMLQTAEVTK